MKRINAMAVKCWQKMQNERNDRDSSEENENEETSHDLVERIRAPHAPAAGWAFVFLTNGGRSTGDGSTRFIACLTPAAME